MHLTGKKAATITNLIVVCGLVLAIAPLLYYGQNSIITPHDNLDQFIGYYKMLKDNGILLSLNAKTPCFTQVSTAYYGYVSYNIVTLLNVFFDVFTAHIISYILKLLVGYASMYLLLKELFNKNENHNIFKLVSLCFALLPSIPVWWLAVDSIPLLAYFFLVIKKLPQSKLDKRVFLLILYPLLSNLAAAGIFLLSIWLIAMIILAIKSKKPNLNLFSGLCSLFMGYIIVDFKLIYITLFLKETTNKVIAKNLNFSIMESIAATFEDFKKSAYHGPTLQSKIILPVILFTMFACILYILIKLKKENMTNVTLKKWVVDFLIISILTIGLMLCFSAAYGAYENGRIERFIANYLPMLQGFNWGRFSFLNRTLAYFLFAFTLVNIANVKCLKPLPYILVLMQFFVIFTARVPYNYANYNLNHAKIIKTDNGITYREFFAQDFFNSIKSDIGYNGEKVAAVGYHPSVLMYNNFATVDGYMSFNTLKYVQSFRKIIAPELEENKAKKNYFDNWGGRMYLFNEDAPYEPTRKKSNETITLRIDTNAFIELGGRYILSRAEIGNANDLGLDFVKSYTNDDSIYQIFVYKAG